MKPEWRILKRVLWPERASMFVIVGGAAGMAGDLTSFFADMVSPAMLAALFGAVAVGAALLCLQRAAMVDAGNPEAVEAVVNCGVCDALRFGLFASACFMLLMVVGQGQSATEKIGETLGLIQRDVSGIREDVAQIADVTQSQALVENPSSAKDFFTNAWIYSYMRRDTSQAFAMMEQLYAKHAPNKLDAAEMYYNTGRQVKGRSALLAEMERLGRANNDATLLVVAGRNAENAEEAERMYALAREMDPQQPFAYWDMQRTNGTMNKGTPEERSAALQKEVSNIETFLKLYNEYPAAHYFFLPQYQGDFNQIGGQMLASYRQNLESYEKMAKMKAALPRRKH